MKITKCIIAALICLYLSVSSAAACSRLIWFTDDYGLFVTRTMDWSVPTKPTIEVRTPGQSYIGAPNGERIVNWTSKYASLTVNFFNVGAIDGFNEAGLSANGLYLDEEDGGPYNPTKRQLENGRIIPYVLDNFSTVEEAMKGLAGIQIQVQSFDGIRMCGHYSLQDAAGDAAVIEFLNGEMKVHHGSQYRVMTNSPIYTKQLENWEGHKPKKTSDFSGSFPVPGNVASDQRFIRNNYMLEQLKQPTSVINGILKLESTAYKVPYDAAYERVGGKVHAYPTEYVISYNLNEKRLYLRYQANDAYTHFMVDFEKLNNGKNWILEAYREDLYGDVTDKFTERDGVMANFKTPSKP